MIRKVPRTSTIKAIAGLFLKEASRWVSLSNRFALMIVVLVHMGATFVLLPPWEVLRSEPLLFSDFPVHAHRVFMYREGLAQGGLPWGYDPALSAGSVIRPDQDLGAKFQQVIGILLPFVPAGMIVRLSIFLAALTCPLGLLLVCRRLRVSSSVQAWVMLTLIAPVWLYKYLANYILYGLVSFAAASFFLPLVLAIYVGFFSQQSLRKYLGLCLAVAALMLVHVLSFVVLVPSLVACALFAGPLSWKWRTAIFLAPLVFVALNGFWLVPFILGGNAPSPPWPHVPTEIHQTYASWSQVIEGFFPVRFLVALCGIGLAAYGFLLLKKIAGNSFVVSFSLAAVFALVLKYFGSFMPIAVSMQPSRFMLPAVVLLALPVGIALARLVERGKLPVGGVAAALALSMAAGAPLLARPEPIDLTPSLEPLVSFISRRTLPTDRLLVQSQTYYEPKGLPLLVGREVIGNTFPETDDPAQFLKETLWGKPLSVWSSQELRLALERWGVHWIFTCHKQAGALMAEATGCPGETVGIYHAFKMPRSSTRFLVGKGSVVPKVNRLELAELVSDSDLIVLRYRYHPAWKASSGTAVLEYDVPEDRTGFIALRNPPRSVTLNFDPWKMLSAPWPQR